MKARIEKKLSKKLKELAPSIFENAWVDKSDFSELAWAQGSRVTGIWSIGGGVDYWGEGQDAYSCWEFFKNDWFWFGDFHTYPEGHKFEGYPNTNGFKPTTINLLKLARKIG